MHDQIQSHCNCSTPQLGDYHHGKPVMLCKDLGPDKECLDRLASSISSMRMSCLCPSECHEARYNTKISVAKWPSRQFWPQLAGK
jgi:hypothetical protein